MFKKVSASIVGVVFSLVSVFAASPASAVARVDGQLDQDWGGTYLNGVAYAEAGESDSTEWTTSVTEGNTVYVAGIEDTNDSVIVQKIVDGVKDTSFGTGGIAVLTLASEAEFDEVSDIDVTADGNILITGTFWDDYTVWDDDDLEGVFALKINSSGGNTGVSFGNADGDTIDDGPLNVAAYFPDWEGQPNGSNEYGWYQDVAETVEFTVEAQTMYAIAGTVDDDYDRSAYVLYINSDGSVATGMGDSENYPGAQFLDWDYNVDSGIECWNWSWSEGLVASSASTDLFMLADCDGDTHVIAFDPVSSEGSLDTTWANASDWYQNYGGALELGDYSQWEWDSNAWEIDTDSNGDIIIAGDVYAYVPYIDSTEWVPYVARIKAAGGYYNTLEGNVDEGAYTEFADWANIDYFNLNDIEVGPYDSVYLVGEVGIGSDSQMWTGVFDSTLSPFAGSNNGAYGGQTVVGSCGDESANTASIQGTKLYMFGRGNNPNAVTQSPWGDMDALSARIGIFDFTQTRSVVAPPTWSDDEWASEFNPGQLYSDAVSATGTGVNYYLSGSLPSNVTLANSGTISGTPDSDDTGNYYQEICASNAGGHVWTEEFEMFPPQPYEPVIESTPSLDSLNVTYGTPITWTVPIDAFPAFDSCWVEDGELPPGLELDEETCVVTGTPRIVGDYYFEIGTENDFDGSWHSDYREYSGEVAGTIPADVVANLLAVKGDASEGAEVELTGFGLEPDSEWYAELRSDPIVIADGLANSFGWFDFTADLPADIAPGEHTITVYGTDTNGNDMSAVVYITVAADGTLGYISTVESESASLASTGLESDGLVALALGSIVLMSIGVVAKHRRRQAHTA